MSWLRELVGAPPLAIASDDHPKVPDPSNPDRLVSTKPANRPFLAYKEYREKQEAQHREWLERKKERDKKIAKGEEVGPEEKDPTGEEEIGVLGLLKFLLYLTIVLLLAGKLITGSFLWDYEVKWAQVKSLIPTNQRLFSERALAEHDGSNPNRPVYIAIDGDVYDVSSNKATYGPGGAYHMMAGVDAARSFGTGCFREHRTHDLRGLSESELGGVNHWKAFFAGHKTYVKVGRVLHHPIDPASPIPEHCDASRREPDQVKDSKKHDGSEPKTGVGDGKHEEL